MKGAQFHITGMTMAITNMEAMLAFYSGLFNIEFELREMYGSKLYAGKWGAFDLLFCPATLAGITARQNRHQFDIVIPDIEQLIDQATTLGGKAMGPITEDENALNVGIYDPDGNSILFKQLRE